MNHVYSVHLYTSYIHILLGDLDPPMSKRPLQRREQLCLGDLKERRNEGDRILSHLRCNPHDLIILGENVGKCMVNVW